MEHYHTKSNRTQVICRLGLMLLPDVGQAMSEIYRVLKPGGRAAAIVQTTPDKSPWLSVPAMIALKHAQLPPPQPGQPGLFGLGSDGVFEGAFQAAGFREIEVYRVTAPNTSDGYCMPENLTASRSVRSG
jgi:SAM-dependent methyltransferase